MRPSRTIRLAAAGLLLPFAACGGGDADAQPAMQQRTAQQPEARQPDAPADDAAAAANTMVAHDLVLEPGYELVLRRCIRCHGPQQFLQQRGDRETWLGLIRWMQRDHGLEQLPDDEEDRIVAYLAAHYGPRRTGRRAPLPAELMPPNPYDAHEPR